jgi:DNA-directed RNA polymerase specialized sigma subunit
LRDPTESIEEQVIRKDMREKVCIWIGCLPPRLREIIYGRFFEGATLEELGIRMHLTRERIRQLEVKALRKLRNQVGFMREFQQFVQDPEIVPPSLEDLPPIPDPVEPKRYASVRIVPKTAVVLDTDEKIKELWKSGMTVKEMASELDMSHRDLLSYILSMRKEGVGFERRPPGARKKRAAEKRKASGISERDEILIAMWQAEISREVIAQTLGIPVSRVSLRATHLRKRGYDLKRRSRQPQAPKPPPPPVPEPPKVEKPKPKPKPKRRKRKRKKRKGGLWDEFIRIWNSAEDLQEVADFYEREPKFLSRQAANLRKQGYDLKRFGADAIKHREKEATKKLAKLEREQKRTEKKKAERKAAEEKQKKFEQMKEFRDKKRVERTPAKTNGESRWRDIPSAKSQDFRKGTKI